MEKQSIWVSEKTSIVHVLLKNDEKVKMLIWFWNEFKKAISIWLLNFLNRKVLHELRLFESHLNEKTSLLRY